MISRHIRFTINIERTSEIQGLAYSYHGHDTNRRQAALYSATVALPQLLPGDISAATYSQQLARTTYVKSEHGDE